MGKRTFPKLAALLIANGLPPATPALLAEAVSTPEQRLLRCSFGELAQQLESANSAHPALILYGPLAEVGSA